MNWKRSLQVRSRCRFLGDTIGARNVIVERPALISETTSGRIAERAEVAELADALRSGRSELYALAGSTPAFGIQSPVWGFLI